MDGFIQWNWREVFCAYWLIFAIGAGITFASGLMFMGKCCSYMFGELETSECKQFILLLFIQILYSQSNNLGSSYNWW